MIGNQEEDEFVAVRVQDPRIQNEGSWNSYVDYKIFLHTNSKAFTAKTSCVRRRYSEFFWLKKQLQKNSGLVPVPDLPGKSFFSFSNEDFLESRRKGLQAFLDKVVHMTVCLSDSQLHLFLQTQLPVGHIEDCVQGHTPYTVMDAILTYASSNRGYAQAQEDDTIKEPSLTVSYESMESPAPHQPCPQTKETFSPELLPCSDPDPLEALLGLQHQDTSSVKVLQKNNHLEAVVGNGGPMEASFFLGDGQDEHEGQSFSEQRSCVIQTPVEVHLPMGAGFKEEDLEENMEKAGQYESLRDVEENEEKGLTEILDFKDGEAASPEEVLEKTRSENHIFESDVISEVNHHVEDESRSSDGQKEPERCSDSGDIVAFQESDACSQEKVLEDGFPENEVLENHVISEAKSHEGQYEDVFGRTDGEKEPEKKLNSGETLDFKDSASEEEVLENVHSEKEVLEDHVTSEGNNLEDHVGDVASPDDISNFDVGREPGNTTRDDLENKDETLDESEIHNLQPQLESVEDNVQQMNQKEEVVLLRTKEEEEEEDDEEDSHSLPSSNESIVKVSDEESVCDEAEEILQAEDGFAKTSAEEDEEEKNILDLHLNGCLVGKEDTSMQEDEDLHYITDMDELNTSTGGGDLTENSDFSVIEMSCTPGFSDLHDGRCPEQETLSSLSLEASEDAHEVEVH